MQNSKLRIGIISAEKSGDYLSESFIDSLKSSGRDFELFGIGGKELDKFNISRPQDFDKEIQFVTGDEWKAGNLSYHLKSRPKWEGFNNKEILNNSSQFIFHFIT